MAFDVRISGPEFLSPENTAAFLRIEESIRQYAAHAHESIVLIRRPLSISEDHFLLLWPRGLALAALYPFDGTIRGSRSGPWQVEPPGTSPERSARQRNVHVFDNPSIALQHGLDELKKIAGDVNISPALLAIFTGEVPRIEFWEPENAPAVRAMTLPYAVARTIVHLPNLLQAAERGNILYSAPELESLAARLTRSANAQRSPVTPSDVLTTRTEYVFKPRRLRIGLIAAIVLLAIILFYILRSAIAPHSAGRSDTAIHSTPAHHAPSEMIIELPSETELVVSTNQYRTRSEFDQALSRGEGTRFLPETQQVIIMDSVALAKGVYGYFRVNNVWRKGKLLQTLEPVDTVTIVKFLDPLP